MSNNKSHVDKQIEDLIKSVEEIFKSAERKRLWDVERKVNKDNVKSMLKRTPGNKRPLQERSDRPQLIQIMVPQVNQIDGGGAA
jgi:hypothetical protein